MSKPSRPRFGLSPSVVANITHSTQAMVSQGPRTDDVDVSLIRFDGKNHRAFTFDIADPDGIAIKDGDPPEKVKTYEEIVGMAASLKAQGQIQPIIVMRKGDILECVAGHLRSLAAKHLGWTRIRAEIHPYDPAKIDSMRFAENVLRSNLSVSEELIGFERLLIRHKCLSDEGISLMTVKDAAKILSSEFGVSSKVAKFYVELSASHSVLKAAVKDGLLTSRTAIRELIGLSEELIKLKLGTAKQGAADAVEPFNAAPASSSTAPQATHAVSAVPSASSPAGVEAGIATQVKSADHSSNSSDPAGGSVGDERKNENLGISSFSSLGDNGMSAESIARSQRAAEQNRMNSRDPQSSSAARARGGQAKFITMGKTGKAAVIKMLAEQMDKDGIFDDADWDDVKDLSTRWALLIEALEAKC